MKMLEKILEGISCIKKYLHLENISKNKYYVKFASFLSLIKKRLKDHTIYVELIIAFIIINLINFAFVSNDPGFIKAQLHPYWIIILLFSSRYGLGAGFLSGLISCFLFIYFLSDGNPTMANIEKLTETNEFLLSLIFILTGVLLGNIREYYIANEAKKDQLLKTIKKDNTKLKDYVKTSEKAYQLLESRIVGETTTVKTLYKCAKKLEALDLNDIYQGCLDMLKEHFHVQKASLYLIEKEYFILKASLGWDLGETVSAKIDYDKSIMKIAFERNTHVLVKDILDSNDLTSLPEHIGQIVAMFPVLDETDQPIGILNIEKIDFLSFHRENLEVINLIVKWSSQAIQRVLFYNLIQSKLIWDEDLDIFNYNHFLYSFNDAFLQARQTDNKLSVALIKIDQFGFFKEHSQRNLLKTLIVLLQKNFKETDKIFHFRIKGILIILSPMVSKRVLSRVVKPVTLEFMNVYKDEIEGNKVSVKYCTEELKSTMKDMNALLNPLLKKFRIE